MTPPDDHRQGSRTAIERRGFASNLSATALILVLNLATGIVLARAFDPEGRGEIALILLWPSVLAAVAQLGLPEAVTYHAARAKTSEGTVLGSGLVIATIRAVVVVTVAAAILPFILSSRGDDILLAGYVYLGFVPGHAYNLLQLAVLNGQGRYTAVALMRVLVIAGAAIPLFVIYVVEGLTPLTIVLIYVAAQAATFVVSALLLRGAWKRLAVSRPLLRELLHYGVRAHVGTISASLNARVDQLVVSLFLSVNDLGLYTIAATMAGATGVVGETVGYVVVPVTARAETDAKRAADARRFTRLTVVVSSLIAVPICIFAPDLIRIIFGPDYLPIADVARILLVATVAFSTARCLEAILRGIGMPWQASVGELIALCVTLASLAVLLPLFGLTGAAVASLLAYLTSLAWMIRLTARRLGFPVTGFIRGA